MRLIDADALIFTSPKDRIPTEGYIETSDIDRAKTIDPVKHGKWESFDLTWGRSVYACTVCGEAIEVPTENGKPIFDYCPNCGAKMEQEDEQN